MNANALSVSEQAEAGSFALFANGQAPVILVDPMDDVAVLRVVRDLQADLEARGGIRSEIRTTLPAEGRSIIVVGSLEGSRWVGELSGDGQIQTADLNGVWEGFSQEIVSNPFEGFEQALVITGSDARGTVYGVYDLIERAGVSPWNWWADVPIERVDQLYISGERRFEKPHVKYRGIFLNDENPALFGWVNETFGGFNHDFYERVFELILRQKGNYLWPAMWGKAFYDDDPMNSVRAAEYGIVVGTSHHEPLARAHVEWDRYGEGDWNYATNEEVLKDFWRFGVERNQGRDALLTIGMRGDGDEAMTEGTAISLLERIVADQREIIADVTGKPASESPQIWALYKEVLDYFDQGMDVPEDVTLLFPDDNWGNIRRLPRPGETREGGYGIYYHFDYVGGPRNYKWINTSQIERVWEQMTLADAHGANEVWIVNVGDLKPMEFPINFFLDLAWDPDDWPLERLPDYPAEWAEQQFGGNQAEEIGALLSEYTRFNSRRKPEMLSPETYSLTNYNEAQRVVDEYNALAQRADAVRDSLPDAYQDAFLQLVWFPIHASANLNELYLAAAKNELYAAQGRASANAYADEVARLFEKDAELTRIYHEDIADGKWNHMMSQTHIGYVIWQQPDEQTPPETVRISVSEDAGLGVAIPGSRQNWADSDGEAELPEISQFAPDRSVSFEVFNTGTTPFTTDISAEQDWVEISQTRATVEDGVTISLNLDWDEVPEGQHSVPVTIDAGELGQAELVLPVENRTFSDSFSGYVPIDGVYSIPATVGRIVNSEAVSWETIPGLGHESDAITTFPQTAQAESFPDNGARIEYDLNVLEPGTYDLVVTLSPTQDFIGQGGLTFGVSLDDEDPRPVMAVEEGRSGEGNQAWEESVGRNAHIVTTQFDVDEAGLTTLKLWHRDPGLVFQKVVFAKSGSLPDTYLGPPTTPFCVTANMQLNCVAP